MGNLGSFEVGAIGGSGAAAAEAAAKEFFPRCPMWFSDFPSEHAIMPYQKMVVHNESLEKMS
jgi:hypothetical protein